MKTIAIEVLRYRPEQDQEPVWQRFEVPYTDDMSVLQGLQLIKDELDGSLSFRWSCRMAICGSCGVMVDGKPRLGCKTFLRDYAPAGLRVEPLAHFPIERDLIVDIEDFLGKLESITPYIVPKTPQPLEAGEYLQTPHELELFEQYSSCINCLLCYAACPQYGIDDKFIGPAAMALLHRYNADSRDGAREQRMQIVNAEEGVWSCTAVGYCSEVCPKGVDPANAVNQNKVASTKDYFLRFVAPKGAAG
ncbi:succinate dehydrogenase/fumarate reductase iron-sulfur subunit [Roseateles violae]|uniref:Succinate dehydrogenase iron-sulfur subunit n=1 Tax=Roseateles violae TaxID=3058042 RepID=A0ABT8DVH5_9BURK|nr:succinate dehydrogenase/fumarate reductase iron-sulfur subunit [Pelomonas sp. PFR6]MDN3920899.1 succinate dehydrogenase/fumarate reductase iron-sulfur subunit [Pelomonas sp. PFR6]